MLIHKRENKIKQNKRSRLAVGFTENKGRPELEEGFPPNSPSSAAAVGKEAEGVQGDGPGGGGALGRYSLLGHLSPS